MNDVDPNVKLVCSTVLVVLACLIVMWSDWYLRPAQIPGTDPRSWDLVGTIMLVIGGKGVWRGLQDKKRPR